MLSLYRDVASRAARRAAASWPVALSLLVYAAILMVAGTLTSGLGIVGGFIMGFVLAACFSSYLHFLAQAVEGARIRLSWDEFKASFIARFYDVISVMFVFWILAMVTAPLLRGEHAAQLSAIMGFAIAFFFNAVPELLYQGRSRSLALLAESAQFVTQNPVAWFAPNLLFALLALWAAGGLDLGHPVALLITLGQLFSSPTGVATIFLNLPIWYLPVELFALHFVMVFRGLLFDALSRGGGNARLRAFRRG